jgi:hypothetical protein
MIFDSFSGFGTGFAGALLNNTCYAWSLYRIESRNCKYYYNIILIHQIFAIVNTLFNFFYPMQMIVMKSFYGLQNILNF